jgi:hypothetical protein
MRGIAVMLACGCGRIAFDAAAGDARTGDGASDAFDAATSTCVDGDNPDDFEDDVACTPWGSTTLVGGAAMVEANGALQVDLPMTINAFAGCVATVPVNFDRGTMFEVEEAPAGAFPESYVLLHNFYVNGTLNLAFFIQGTNIAAKAGTAGAESHLGDRAYSPEGDRFLRWRRQDASTLIAETSPDAEVWTTLATTTQMQPTTVRVDITAGTTNGLAMPGGRVRIASYNTCPR